MRLLSVCEMQEYHISQWRNQRRDARQEVAFVEHRDEARFVMRHYNAGNGEQNPAEGKANGDGDDKHYYGI